MDATKVYEWKAKGWVAWAAAVYVITSLLFIPVLVIYATVVAVALSLK